MSMLAPGVVVTGAGRPQAVRRRCARSAPAGSASCDALIAQLASSTKTESDVAMVAGWGITEAPLVDVGGVQFGIGYLQNGL